MPDAPSMGFRADVSLDKSSATTSRTRCRKDNNDALPAVLPIISPMPAIWRPSDRTHQSAINHLHRRPLSGLDTP